MADPEETAFNPRYPPPLESRKPRVPPPLPRLPPLPPWPSRSSDNARVPSPPLLPPPPPPPPPLGSSSNSPVPSPPLLPPTSVQISSKVQVSPFSLGSLLTSVDTRVPSPPPLWTRHAKSPSTPNVPQRSVSDAAVSQDRWQNQSLAAQQDQPFLAPPKQHGAVDQLGRSNSDGASWRPTKVSPSPSPSLSPAPALSPSPSPSPSLSPRPGTDISRWPPPSRLGDRAYQYVPFADEGEIRLVRILPQRKTMIRCEIVHASLANPPPYVAVSYAWGDSGDTRRIEVEGSPVPVSVSLHGALQALRKRDVPTMVWVDALCIDQQNKAERMQQVQLMTSIYSRANYVAVWLGPEEDDSARAVSFMSRIAELPDDQSGQVARILASRDAVKDLVAVSALFGRSYWRRLWVVQEVFHARKVFVYCGSTMTTWHIYQVASGLFRRHREDMVNLTNLNGGGKRSPYPSVVSSPDQLSQEQVLIHQGPSSLPDLGSLINKPEGALLEVLCACRRKLSSDPRDKVYGILGVLHPEVRGEFRPDYDLSVREVYLEVVDYLLTTTGCLDVICESIYFPPHTSSADLPSFAPDWSHIPQVTSLGRKYSFQASGSARAMCRFKDERLSRLEVSAVPLDTVDVKGMAVGTMCNAGDYLMAFLHWRALLLQRITEEVDQQQVQEDFAATLSLGQIPTTHANQGQWLAACYSVFSNLIRQRLPSLSLDQSLAEYLDLRVDIEPNARRQFLQKYFGEMMMGRCFFITHESNYLGMGTGFMLPGDEVVVPLGCSTPILLRQEGTQGEYRYVGDAYIHGYMNGKAVDELNSGTREVRQYVLH